jgi:hypothetical protein
MKDQLASEARDLRQLTFSVFPQQRTGGHFPREASGTQQQGLTWIFLYMNVSATQSRFSECLFKRIASNAM